MEGAPTVMHVAMIGATPTIVIAVLANNPVDGLIGCRDEATAYVAVETEKGNALQALDVTILVGPDGDKLSEARGTVLFMDTGAIISTPYGTLVEIRDPAERRVPSFLWRGETVTVFTDRYAVYSEAGAYHIVLA